MTQPDGSQQRQRLRVKIPPGVDQGSRIRLRGKGRPGPNGAPGDLIIRVHVAPHPYFRRQGDDIYLDLPVTIAEAALGAKIDVPTLSGTTTVTVPPGSSSGRKLRLKGKGVRSRKSQTPGDMYAVLKVMVPKELDEASRELLQNFARRNPQPDIRSQWH